MVGFGESIVLVLRSLASGSIVQCYADVGSGSAIKCSYAKDILCTIRTRIGATSICDTLITAFAPVA